MEPIKERIQLDLDASGVKANSLSGLITDLKAVEQQIQKINAAVNGLPVGPNVARTVDQFKKQIQQAQTKVAAQGGNVLKPADLAKTVGLDLEGFERYLTQKGKAIANQFRSINEAAKAAGGYERNVVHFRRAAVGDLLTPRVSAVTPTAATSGPVSVSGGAIAAKVEGMIQLVIPSTQVHASVIGPVGATGSGGVSSFQPLSKEERVHRQNEKVAAFKESVGREPTDAEMGAMFTGKSVPSGGGGGGGKKGGKRPMMIPGGPGELGRVTTETDKYLREAITSIDAAGDVLTKTYDSAEQAVIKTVKKHQSGRSPMEQFREAKRLADEQLKQAKAGLDPSDPGFGLAGVLKKQAAQMRALMTPGLKASLGVKGGEVERLLGEGAATLEARAGGVHSQAVARREAAVRQANERALEQQTQAAVRRFGKWGDITAHQGPIPPKIPPAKPPKESEWERESRLERNRATRGLRGLFTLSGFGANLMNVTAWAAPVTALYKGFELASHSLQRYVELTREMAQLGQVYRGVGGSVQELTNDVLRLASAQGRGTGEGMESAKEWARLGLSRKEVNEAVRVSMVAANVADMHTAETTKQLSSLMHVYGMEVADLSGVLGVLVSTSQRYNVTLEDLFLGLDRSAGVAKQAGVSFAELQGLIGAVVGKTGQSGVIVGNTIKSILVQFNNPDMQKFLRGYKIETTTKEGAQKSGSQVLREMYVQYQRLNDTERQNLTMRVAGRLQASRFVALMENYIESQRLAIEGQLHLNTAQESNVRILGSIKAQLAGVRAEWDRFVTATFTQPGPGGSPSLGETFAGGVRTTKNVMRLWNNLGGGPMGLAGSMVDSVLPPGLKLSTLAPLVGMGIGKFNEWMESLMERGQSAFENAVQQHSMAAAGNLQKQQLFATVSDALQMASSAERRNSIAEMIAPMMGGQGDSLKELVGRGDIASARKLLAGAGHEAYQSALEEKKAEFGERNRRIAQGKQQIAEANAELGAPGASDEAKANAKQKLAEAQKAVNQAMSEAKDIAAYMPGEEEGLPEEAIARRQEYVNILKEQQMVMEALGELASQQTLDTATSRNDARVIALHEQKTLLEDNAQRLANVPGVEAYNARMEIQRQQAEVNAEYAARTSPQMTTALTMMDNQSLAARRAREESATWSVGYTESERLLRQEGFLNRELGVANQRRETGQLTDNEAVRAKEMEIQLWHTQEQIQTRLLELSRQERQIRIDATREFQKNLLLAGPGEQLQRMYVMSRASSGKMSSGEFMSMSPEMKRMYYDLQGGEAGAKNREEQAMMRGRGRTLEQQQADMAEAGARVRDWGREVYSQRFGQLPMSSMPIPAQMQDAAKKSMEQLSAKAAVAATSMEWLSDKVVGLGKIIDQVLHGKLDSGTRNAITTGARVGLSTGFAMGAQ